MIKFFRKIRQRLLVDGKFSKYPIYALGEIVLVVIGILIALSINNWNSSRKDRIREAVILNQIHKDFSSNKLQLDSILEFHTQKVSKTQTLVEQMLRSKDTSLINLMMSYGDDIVSFKTFNPSNGSIDAIINSSSFDLISNDSLRGLLVAWKDVYSDYSEEEHYALQFQMNHLFPFFRKQFDYLKF